jgi:SAM-dependent methyltransferase
MVSKSSYEVRVIEQKVWRGGIYNEDKALFSRMETLVADMENREKIIKVWWEHCQWEWKQWEYAFAIKNVECNPNVRVVDAGCGYTPMIRYFASLGAEAYGFDLELDGPLSMNQQLLYGDKVHYQRQSLEKIEWDDNFFDYVVSISTLEHIFNARFTSQVKKLSLLIPPLRRDLQYMRLEKAFRELVRICKPGGKLVITIDAGGNGIDQDILGRLLGCKIEKLPSMKEIRSYWVADDYYIHKNILHSQEPKNYTVFAFVAEKTDKLLSG